MDLKLNGKVALITGGSQGIGLATAVEFAREGIDVVICARRQELLDEAVAEINKVTGRSVLALSADVSKASDIDRVVDSVITKYGRLDILVNNAGRSAAASFEEVDDTIWNEDLDLKLMAAIRCSRVALPHLEESGEGRIINITAVGGKAPPAGSLPTSVSRAAGIALTKAMSKDLAKKNILVNTICIGLVKSGQIENAARSRFPDLTLEEAYSKMGSPVPLGRVGEAREVAALAAFLASPLSKIILGVSDSLGYRNLNSNLLPSLTNTPS